MAGEWIAYDLALPSKPEVQELLDLTGDPRSAMSDEDEAAAVLAVVRARRVLADSMACKDAAT